MTTREMHYDVKVKLNKVDSQTYKNLRVPEIDWALNEAYEIFVKLVAFPRIFNRLGFERTQRNIDDIRPLVKNSGTLVPVSDQVTLPNDYWHFLKGYTIISKPECKTSAKARIKIRQHDDEFESSPFHKSSFEWRTVNAVFNSQGLEFFDDGSFSVDSCSFDYVKKLTYIHNAQDFPGGQYNHPNGVTLVGTVNCELPDHTHREIVDIAVLLITGQIQIPDYQVKFNKLNFNHLN